MDAIGLQGVWTAFPMVETESPVSTPQRSFAAVSFGASHGGGGCGLSSSLVKFAADQVRGGKHAEKRRTSLPKKDKTRSDIYDLKAKIKALTDRIRILEEEVQEGKRRAERGEADNEALATRTRAWKDEILMEIMALETQLARDAQQRVQDRDAGEGLIGGGIAVAIVTLLLDVGDIGKLVGLGLGVGGIIGGATLLTRGNN